MKKQSEYDISHGYPANAPFKRGACVKTPRKYASYSPFPPMRVTQSNESLMQNLGWSRKVIREESEGGRVESVPYYFVNFQDGIDPAGKRERVFQVFLSLRSWKDMWSDKTFIERYDEKFSNAINSYRNYGQGKEKEYVQVSWCSPSPVMSPVPQQPQPQLPGTAPAQAAGKERGAAKSKLKKFQWNGRFGVILFYDGIRTGLFVSVPRVRSRQDVFNLTSAWQESASMDISEELPGDPFFIREGEYVASSVAVKHSGTNHSFLAHLFLLLFSGGNTFDLYPVFMDRPYSDPMERVFSEVYNTCARGTRFAIYINVRRTRMNTVSGKHRMEKLYRDAKGDWRKGVNEEDKRTYSELTSYEKRSQREKTAVQVEFIFLAAGADRDNVAAVQSAFSKAVSTLLVEKRQSSIHATASFRPVYLHPAEGLFYYSRRAFYRLKNPYSFISGSIRYPEKGISTREAVYLMPLNHTGWSAVSLVSDRLLGARDPSDSLFDLQRIIPQAVLSAPSTKEDAESLYVFSRHLAMKLSLTDVPVQGIGANQKVRFRSMDEADVIGEVLVGKDRKGSPVTIPVPGKAGDFHNIVVGKTGMGKTTLLAQLAVQLMNYGNVLMVDIHGDVMKKLRMLLPDDVFVSRVVPVNFRDRSTIGFNLLNVFQGLMDEDRLTLNLIRTVIGAVRGAYFRDMEGSGIGPKIDKYAIGLAYYFRVIPGATLVDVYEALNDPAKVVGNLKAMRKPENAAAIDQILSVLEPLVSLKDFQREDLAGSSKRLLEEFVKSEELMAFFCNRSVVGAKAVWEELQATDSRALGVPHPVVPGKVFVINVSSEGSNVTYVSAAVAGLLEIFKVLHKIYWEDPMQVWMGDQQVVRDMHAPPLFVFLDEVGKYIYEGVVDIIETGRKYGINAVLATQTMAALRDALGGRAGADTYSRFVSQFRNKFIGVVPEDDLKDLLPKKDVILPDDLTMLSNLKYHLVSDNTVHKYLNILYPVPSRLQRSRGPDKNPVLAKAVSMYNGTRAYDLRLNVVAAPGSTLNGVPLLVSPSVLDVENRSEWYAWRGSYFDFKSVTDVPGLPPPRGSVLVMDEAWKKQMLKSVFTYDWEGVDRFSVLVALHNVPEGVPGSSFNDILRKVRALLDFQLAGLFPTNSVVNDTELKYALKMTYSRYIIPVKMNNTWLYEIDEERGNPLMDDLGTGANAGGERHRTLILWSIRKVLRYCYDNGISLPIMVPMSKYNESWFASRIPPELPPDQASSFRMPIPDVIGMNFDRNYKSLSAFGGSRYFALEIETGEHARPDFIDKLYRYSQYNAVKGPDSDERLFPIFIFDSETAYREALDMVKKEMMKPDMGRLHLSPRDFRVVQWVNEGSLDLGRAFVPEASPASSGGVAGMVDASPPRPPQGPSRAESAAAEPAKPSRAVAPASLQDIAVPREDAMYYNSVYDEFVSRVYGKNYENPQRRELTVKGFYILDNILRRKPNPAWNSQVRLLLRRAVESWFARYFGLHMGVPDLSKVTVIAGESARMYMDYLYSTRELFPAPYGEYVDYRDPKKQDADPKDMTALAVNSLRFDSAEPFFEAFCYTPGFYAEDPSVDLTQEERDGYRIFKVSRGYIPSSAPLADDPSSLPCGTAVPSPPPGQAPPPPPKPSQPGQAPLQLRTDMGLSAGVIDIVKELFSYGNLDPSGTLSQKYGYDVSRVRIVMVRRLWRALGFIMNVQGWIDGFSDVPEAIRSEEQKLKEYLDSFEVHASPPIGQFLMLGSRQIKGRSSSLGEVRYYYIADMGNVKPGSYLRPEAVQFLLENDAYPFIDYDHPFAVVSRDGSEKRVEPLIDSVLVRLQKENS